MLKKILSLFLILEIVNSQDVCSSPGQFCSKDCQKFLLCEVKGYGELLEPSVIEDCSTDSGLCNYLSGSHCVAQNESGIVGTCAPITDPPVAANVQCATGWTRMPHPTDCTKFIDCADPANPTTTSCSCPDGALPSSSFDPETGLCGLSMESGICAEGLTPICRKILENKTGQVKCNPSIYWECTKDKDKGYLMSLKACPIGKQFDTGKNTCINAYIDGPFCLNGNEVKFQDNAYMYR